MLHLKWRPGDNYQKFNQRTAMQIYKWFAQFKTMLLHHRVLKAVFQAAWRERNVNVARGDQPLRWAR
eukprot:2937245-Karenia_brevis.AAC.1